MGFPTITDIRFQVLAGNLGYKSKAAIELACWAIAEISCGNYGKARKLLGVANRVDDRAA